MSDAEMEKGIRVEETLANALGMWSTSTTPHAMARYVHEQLGLDYPDYFDMRPEAVRFLIGIAHGLTPPDDKRMSFAERPGRAALIAVPRSYGEALNTMVAMGWGNTRLDIPTPTPREIGEVIKQELDRRARAFATRLLEKWAIEGHVYRL